MVMCQLTDSQLSDKPAKHIEYWYINCGEKCQPAILCSGHGLDYFKERLLLAHDQASALRKSEVLAVVPDPTLDMFYSVHTRRDYQKLIEPDAMSSLRP